MQRRRLGRTGHESSLAVLGAAAFWNSETGDAEPAFNAALAAGVNHLDIAPQYGAAERAVGPLIPARRSELFIGCKTTRRNPDGVRAQLENSLSLLGCDAFDLYQLHAVCDIEELDARAGAVAAILQARDEGLCRYVGITGHDVTVPATHTEALRRYDLDTVMFPVNRRLWADDAYRRDAEGLLAVCAERDLGVMAIKSVARRPWPAGADHHATTWYEPYQDDADIETSVRFTLSVPGVHAIATAGDVHLLPRVLAAVDRFEPLPADELLPVAAAVAAEPILGRPG
ncbi:MAG TPA: aldo/keto reductase [Acidimicrobiales bacterium]|nr:aldo/keto reductase [Acidimicrobiales bacterium]